MESIHNYINYNRHFLSILLGFKKSKDFDILILQIFHDSVWDVKFK